jgi:anaerobic ribonucleoside-triphosphate reductase activating protein
VAISWRVHAVLPHSYANGPGARFVIWTQGCTLACPGCFNPETHPEDLGEPRAPGELASQAAATPDIEGVTLTGGEPLQQPGAVEEFCQRIKTTSSLGVVILTGFTRREITHDSARSRAVRHADMVIAGRYNASRRLGTGLRGSDNKEYWARTARYQPGDFASIPDVEFIVAPDGTLTVTGMPVTGLPGLSSVTWLRDGDVVVARDDGAERHVVAEPVPHAGDQQVNQVTLRP